MNAEPNSSDETPKGEQNLLPIADAVPAPPAIQAIKVVGPVVIQSEPAAQPTQQPPTEIQITQQPLRVHVTEDDELSQFERMTIGYGKFGILVAFLAFVAASVTGYFIYEQFVAMEEANEAAGFAAKKARYEAKASDIATARQLAILQDQLIQQRNALEMDQRPWLKFELGGERPKDVDPNNSKSRLLTTTAGQPIKIETRVTNIGKTTAERILGTLIVQYVPKGGKPIIPKRENRIIFTENGRQKKGENNVLPGTAWGEATLYPKEVSENSFSRYRWGKGGVAEDDPITQLEKDELEKGNAYLLLLGQVWYSDVFGVRHWTKFCEMSSQLDYAVAKKCIAFGAVDANQPKR